MAFASNAAYAQNVTADTVTDNGDPPRWTSSACRATLPDLSDGSNANPGICFLGPVDPNYTMTFTFSPANAQFLTGIEIWANEGRSMSDNELRRLDVEVDYFDPSTNSIATFSLDDVDIGDTITFDDPKLVSFGAGGLYQATAVRISNLVGTSPNGQATFREVQGVFAVLPVAPEISIVSSETGAVSDGGTDAQGTETVGVPKTVTYTVTNTGTDFLDLSGTPTISGASNVAGAIGVTAPGISSLAPGESTTFDVTYTPDADGPFGFEIDVPNNDPDEGPYDIAVSGDANEAPSVTLVAEPGPATGPFPITATFSEPVSGITIADFNVVNGTPSGFANPSPGVYTILVTVADPTQPISVSVPAAAGTDADGEPNSASNVIGIAIANAPSPTELTVIEDIIIDETLRDLRSSIAFNQSAVREARERHAGYLACRDQSDLEDSSDRSELEDFYGCSALRDLTVEPEFQGKFSATEKSMVGSGSFFAQKSNPSGTKRRLAFGELSFSRYDDNDTMIALQGRVAWERLLGQDVLGGVFVGAKASRTDISDEFTGTRTGYGVNAGAYFVDQLDTNLFWDGYISVGAGRNNLDLTNDALNVEGDYNTVSAEAGLAVTGERAFDNFVLFPELSIAYGVTSVGDATLASSSISGTSEEVVSVGSVALGVIRFRPEFVFPGETDRFGVVRRSLSIAPSLLCETTRARETTSECGGGLELEWSSLSKDGFGQFSARASREIVGGVSRDLISLTLERQF